VENNPKTTSDSEVVVDCQVMPTGVVYAPRSIWHGASLRYMSKPTLLNIELERMRDFVDFLFSSKEYIDWCGQDEAWEDFEKYEIENQ